MSYLPANHRYNEANDQVTSRQINDMRSKNARKKRKKIRKKNLNQFVFDSVKLGLIPVMFLGFQIQPLK